VVTILSRHNRDELEAQVDATGSIGNLPPAVVEDMRSAGLLDAFSNLTKTSVLYVELRDVNDITYEILMALSLGILSPTLFTALGLVDRSFDTTALPTA